MKAITALFLMVAILVAQILQLKKPEEETSKIPQPIKVVLLKKEKNKIDSMVHVTVKNQRSKDLLVLVRLDNGKMRVVTNGKFPENVETTFNVLTDNAGNVLYILESPFSESGDWDIEYRSYFHKNGTLYAFEKFKGFFNEECTTGNAAIHETTSLFFDESGRRVDSTFKILDSKHRPVKYPNCGVAYNYPYKIIKSVREYLTKNKINLNQSTR